MSPDEPPAVPNEWKSLSTTDLFAHLEQASIHSWKDVVAELSARGPSSSSTSLAIQSYRNKTLPDWLLAHLLSATATQESYDALCDILGRSTENRDTATIAATGLMKADPSRGFAYLATLLSSDSPREARSAAVHGLAYSGLSRAIEVLVDAVRSGIVGPVFVGFSLASYATDSDLVEQLLASDDPTRYRVGVEMAFYFVHSASGRHVNPQGTKLFDDRLRALIKSRARVHDWPSPLLKRVLSGD